MKWYQNIKYNVLIDPITTSFYDSSLPSPFHNISSQSSHQILNDSIILKFFKDGHVLIPNLIDSNLIKNDFFNEIMEIYENNKLETIKHKLRVTLGMNDVDHMNINECEDILSQVDQENIPFMQLFNIWRKNSNLRRIGEVIFDILESTSYLTALYMLL